MEKLTLDELDLAVLRIDDPAHGLVMGDVGTIVFVHDHGGAYEVEFVTAGGQTVAVLTLEADKVEALSGDQILHIRKLAAS